MTAHAELVELVVAVYGGPDSEGLRVLLQHTYEVAYLGGLLEGLGRGDQGLVSNASLGCMAREVAYNSPIGAQTADASFPGV